MIGVGWVGELEGLGWVPFGLGSGLGEGERDRGCEWEVFGGGGSGGTRDLGLERIRGEMVGRDGGLRCGKIGVGIGTGGEGC